MLKQMLAKSTSSELNKQLLSSLDARLESMQTTFGTEQRDSIRIHEDARMLIRKYAKMALPRNPTPHQLADG